MLLESPLTIAVPKGRILEELQPLLVKVGIKPEAAFFDEDSRQLKFECDNRQITLIRVRSFDVPTFVAFGGAHLGIAGSDVLMEFNYKDIYQPLDLKIGKCRLSVAAMSSDVDAIKKEHPSHIRIATKYPSITRNYYAKRGVQAECIKLNGAIELAPDLGLSQRIVDLVSSGQTLKANGLEEIGTITQVSSHLIINRSVFKTRSREMNALIAAFNEAVNDL